MKKILSFVFALVLSLTFVTASYAHGYTYWTSSTKLGVGHFAYNETAGDSDSGTALCGRSIFFIAKLDMLNAPYFSIAIILFKTVINTSPQITL